MTQEGHNHRQVKAWIVAVSMGYGHLRPAHTLRHLAHGGSIINADSYAGIPASDREVWKNSRSFYEFISRFKQVPLIGEKVFDFYDYLQAIPQFYPRRDLSGTNVQLRQIYRYIHKGWGRDLIERLTKRSGRRRIPFLTTFFATAFMADEHGYPGDIFCLATDADISRSWAPLKPARSRINYLASNVRVKERLILYGVPANRIFYTGFPLPVENIGSRQAPILRQDLGRRLFNLDPARRYYKRYKETAIKQIGAKNLVASPHHKFTLMFAVGGAGAQKDIGATLMHSLRQELKDNQMRLILVAGIHNNVRSFFAHAARQAGLGSRLGNNIQIIHASTKMGYFTKFHHALRTTDVLWTKPSELSFYGALGIPIIMSPPIGSQEIFNRKWLDTIGSGIDQEDPSLAHEWLFDWLNSGWLAEAAMQGYLEMPRFGSYNIAGIIAHKEHEVLHPEVLLQY